MTTYRRTWWVAVAVGWVVACPLAVLTVATGALVVLALLAAACAASVGASTAAVEMPITERIRYISRYALVGAVSAVAAIGLVAGLGPLGLLIVASGVATSPPVWQRVYVWRRRRQLAEYDAQIPRDERTLREPQHRPVSELSTPDLVMGWRASFASLNKAHTTASMSRVVARRQQYLDELERRDPDGLHRWLNSGARAASDPTEYLRPDEGGASPPEAA